MPRQGGVKSHQVHGLRDDPITVLTAQPLLPTPRTAADARSVPGGGENVRTHGGALKLEARELHGQGDVADPAFHGGPAEGHVSPRRDQQPGEDA